jgi:hypothetical protein
MCACVLLAPHTAQAAERSVRADFDGDGQRDHASLDRLEPSVVRIWLSTTRSAAIVRSPTPIAGIAALDLDGDRRAELIAGGASTGLQIWTARRHGLSPFASQQVPGTLARPVRHTVADDPDDEPPAVAPAASSPIALELASEPRAPTPARTRVADSRTFLPCSSGHAASLSPRAPPLSR